MNHYQLSTNNYQLPEGYKQTEIGVIPEDWNVRCLGEIGQSLIGLTYRPEDTRDFGMLVLRSSNVQNNRLAYENNVYVDSALPLPSRVIVEEGDILICVRNGSKQLIGKCALIDSQAAGSAFGAFMSVFRTKISGFVFYQFQSDVIQTQINEIMGATINQITNKDMAAFQIPLPPSEEEQRSISQALSDVNALIASLDKAIAKKRHLKTATMQQLLKGKKRLPGFGEGKGYQETEVGVIPEDWELTRLGEIATFQGGYAFSSYKFRETGKFQVVKMSNVYGGELNLRRSSSFLETIDSSEENFLLNKDDILISLTGTVGKEDFGYTCRIKDEKNLLLNQRLSRIIISENSVPVLIEFETKLNRFRKQFFDKAKGGTGNQTNVSTIDLAEILIPLAPSIDEQQAIATVLSDMDAAIAALETRLAKTQALKQGMMQALLTGRVRLV